MRDSAHRRRAPSTRPAETPDELTRDELRRLAKAERKLSSPDAAQASSGRREILDLERRHAERVEASRLAERLAETSQLARARGEEVKAETVRIATPLLDEHGARVVQRGLPIYRQETVSRVRIASRGGLQLAFERGDLDGGPVKAERLYETGKTYRAAFERAAGLTTAQRHLSPVSARPPMRGSAGPQEAVFAAGETLRRYRAPLSERERTVLDQVCGLDLTVRATARALRSDPRTVRKVLVEGLAAAGEAWRTARS
jgi:hypothetical protein